ncbi:MAG: signal peptidase I [Actinomycetia bacterium]|nr:signal peptidase I [Actinomycetes bacterium]
MKSSEKKPRTIAQSIGSAFATLIFMLSVVLVIYTAVTVIEAKNDPKNAFLFGFKPVVVMTSSMDPYILENSVVIIQKTEFSEVKIGDVITYDVNNQFVTHRVVAISGNQILVQGDANDTPDAQLVTAENFVGSVAYRMNWLQPILTAFKVDPLKAAIHYLVVPIVSISLAVFIVTMVRKFIQIGKPQDTASPSAELRPATEKLSNCEE